MLRPRLSGLKLWDGLEVLIILLRVNAEAAIERIETLRSPLSPQGSLDRMNTEAAIERIETSSFGRCELPSLTREC
jgi:hypothetical protein